MLYEMSNGMKCGALKAWNFIRGEIKNGYKKVYG